MRIHIEANNDLKRYRQHPMLCDFLKRKGKSFKREGRDAEAAEVRR